MNRVIELRWPTDRVLAIHEDQGKRGTTAEGELGFQRPLVDVFPLSDHRGIMGVEVLSVPRASHRLNRRNGGSHDPGYRMVPNRTVFR